MVVADPVGRIEAGVACRIDPEATRQAVLNLLDNAVKYGASGKRVEVGVRRAAGAAVVWIEDGGPGARFVIELPPALRTPES